MTTDPTLWLPNGTPAPSSGIKAQETADELAGLSRSVVGRPPQEQVDRPVGPSFLMWFAQQADGFTPWGMNPKLRDRQLREFFPTENLLASALATVCARNAALSWRITGDEQTAEAAQQMCNNVNFGAGWEDFISRISIDLYTQDSGAFVEFIREKDSPDSPVIGLTSLDAARCYPTGVPEFPVVYEDTRGIFHRMPWYSVVQLLEMPSAATPWYAGFFYRIQFCAVSRVLRAAQVAKAIATYREEKIGGRMMRAIHLISGVDEQHIKDSIARSQAFADNAGQQHYMQPAIVGSVDPQAAIGHQVVELASLPDGFNQTEETKDYILALSMGMLTDYQEFAPLPGGGLGTATQSETLHAKARGRGPGLFQKLILRLMNQHGGLPANVTFEFDEPDMDAQEQEDRTAATRANERGARLASGEIDPEAARELALEAGDLTQEQFDALEKRAEERRKEMAAQMAEQAKQGAEGAPGDRPTGDQASGAVEGEAAGGSTNPSAAGPTPGEEAAKAMVTIEALDLDASWDTGIDEGRKAGETIAAASEMNPKRGDVSKLSAERLDYEAEVGEQIAAGLAAARRIVDAHLHGAKFNDSHDPSTGRFTTGVGAGEAGTDAGGEQGGDSPAVRMIDSLGGVDLSSLGIDQTQVRTGSAILHVHEEDAQWLPKGMEPGSVVKIDSLHIKERGTPADTLRALRDVTRAADSHGVTLTLDAQPFRTNVVDGPREYDVDALKRLYGRYGFVEPDESDPMFTGYDSMVRAPRASGRKDMGDEGIDERLALAAEGALLSLGTREFDESQHPRDDAGRFATAPGGDGGGRASADGDLGAPGSAAWAAHVASAIKSGRDPVIASRDLPALLWQMSAMDSHPDITELNLDGTRLMGADGLGIDRVDMPQIPPEARPTFLRDIHDSKGVSVKAERVDPSALQPVQKDVSGSRAGAIFNKFRGSGIPDTERILISRDNYIIDGHHTWAAAVGLHYAGVADEMPVYRIGLTAREALKVSLDWAAAHGYEGQAIDAKPVDAKKALYDEVFDRKEFDESQHPRDDAGKFATAPGGSGPSPRELKGIIARQGGVTLDVSTGKQRHDGLAVAIFPDREFAMSPSEWHNRGRALLADYMARNADLLRGEPSREISAHGGKAYLGAWYDRESGKVVLDVSVVIGDAAQATALARRYDQKAIYDLGSGREIPTGGSGGVALASKAAGRELLAMVPLDELDGDEALTAFERAIGVALGGALDEPPEAPRVIGKVKEVRRVADGYIVIERDLREGEAPPEPLVIPGAEANGADDGDDDSR